MSMGIELPGETPLDRTKEALRRVASYISFEADINQITLYDTRGGTEEGRWRHVWLFLTRTCFDLQEADLARAWTEQAVELGLRSEHDKPVHHDTIANACHHIEDLITVPDAAREIERMGEIIIERTLANRMFRATILDAAEKLKIERSRERASARRYSET
jgi:hypothetical protein